jgi:hypothetical protein
MANQSVEKRPTTPLPPSLIHNCLNRRSQHPCPPLIVIAMRYAQGLARCQSDGSRTSDKVLAFHKPPG